MARAPTRGTAYDRPIRAEDNSKVSFSAFAFLFSEMCSRANTVPTKVKLASEAEERVAALVSHVGTRLLQIIALRDPVNCRQRYTTVESFLNFISSKLWVKWFGKQAELQRETGSDRYYVIDNDLLLTRHVHPNPDYLDGDGNVTLAYTSFVGGMLQGVLESCLFPAKVVSYHQSVPGQNNRALFAVEFDPVVWSRERRMKA